MMSMSHVQPPPTPPATGVAAPGAIGSLPNVTGTTTPTTVVAASSELVDTDAPPTVSSTGQLATFSVFETKNPFKPQVTTPVPGAAGSSTSSTGPPSGAPAPS